MLVTPLKNGGKNTAIFQAPIRSCGAWVDNTREVYPGLDQSQSPTDKHGFANRKYVIPTPNTHCMIAGEEMDC